MLPDARASRRSSCCPSRLTSPASAVRRGLKLNYPEATALIADRAAGGCAGRPQSARADGSGKTVLARDDVMDGVARDA